MSTAIADPVQTLDAVDNCLLNAVQSNIPLVRQPYTAIARDLNLPESQVLDRLTTLHTGPRSPIRQISAIFDSRALGYQSTLVAAKVAEDQLEHAAAVINAHPGVSHNYRRDHCYNLWFTLAVAPDSHLGLDTTAAILQRRANASVTRLMPTLKLYKIGVKLNLGDAGNGSPVDDSLQTAPLVASVSEQDKLLIRALQKDLPIVENPFDTLAAEAGVSVEQLLEAAERFRQQGTMRRFSAVLRHRELGFDANPMGVWCVPPEKQDAFGAKTARFSEVSHCYLRPSYPDWPYSIFTMIHTRDRAAATQVLHAISAATGVGRYAALYSTHEYKKVRVQYFTPDAQAWEAGVIAGES